VCKTPKGNIRTIREKGRPIIDDNGTVIALKGTMEPVGQKDISSPETISYVKLLTEQNQQLWNFAHIASHNLRSHASNLQMTLDVMSNTTSEDEKKFFLETIQKISSAFSDTVANLNKLLSKDLNKLKTTIQFSDVLASVTAALTAQIKETNAVIESDFRECPTIEYIPAYLESIILNFVSNAIRYRHPHRAPHIGLRTFIKDDNKYLSVKDNGIGIDLGKHEDKLFRMHQSFHAHPDSMGLGLLITKNQIESFGGSIEVESEPGTGTTFTIRF
jgi:light-regulated signal transduction histidine kinase (bacteriophytochrome)